MGAYLLRAGEADGFPETSFSIFGGSSATVRLSPESPVGNVVVRLGPKAASIAPSFIDAETGDAVRPSTRIWVWSGPYNFVSTIRQPNPDLLVPSGKPIGVEFTARGYEPWRYPDGSAPGRPLTIGAGEKQTILVEFQRSPAMRALDARLMEPGASEADVIEALSQMVDAAPNDARTGREIAAVVTQRKSTTLAQGVFAKYLSEELVTACLDSTVPAIRQTALKSLFGFGNMVLHLAPKLRELADNPSEEPETQRLARQVMATVQR